MPNKFGFEQLQLNLQKMQRELPIVLANQAQNFFVSSFTKQGWEGHTWKTPQRRIEGTKAYKYPKTKGLSRRVKPTLIESGILRRAVSTSIRTRTMQSIRLVVDLLYAKRHNEGLDGMPKRQFMGDSFLLRTEQKKTIKSYISKLWRQ